MPKENDIWKTSHERIKKFENEVLKTVFPYAKFSEIGMSGSPDIAPKTFNAKISSEIYLKIHNTNTKEMVNLFILQLFLP